MLAVARPEGDRTSLGQGRAELRAGLRAALLAGASAFALAALGASGVARAACVPSLQIIARPISGPVVSNGGAITVTGSGRSRVVPAATALTP